MNQAGLFFIGWLLDAFQLSGLVWEANMRFAHTHTRTHTRTHSHSHPLALTRTAPAVTA